MATANPTITVYTKTTRRWLQIVEDAKAIYRALSISKIWIGHYDRMINDLLLKDVKWIEFCKEKYYSEVNQYLGPAFSRLVGWLMMTRDSERNMSGCDANRLQELEYIVIEIKTKMLAGFLRRKGDNILNVEGFAGQYVQQYMGQSMDTLLLKAKKDIFRSQRWPPNKPEMDWELFISELNLELFFFIGEEGVNKIYQQEIKKNLRIKTNISFSMLEDVFSYFLGTISKFHRFINRNYLYGLVEQGLEKNTINYLGLPENQNSALGDRYLIVSHSKPSGHQGKIFTLTTKGVPKSERYVQDHLIIFGKNSSEEFTNDINLPNMKDVDSIFAFIYVNSAGYFLVDISQVGSVKMKIDPGSRTEVKEGDIIVIGERHEFFVGSTSGIDVNGLAMKNLVLTGMSNCNTTSKFQNVVINFEGNGLMIGRDSAHSLPLDFEDVNINHAHINYDRRDNKWYLNDNMSQGGTYKKLKTKLEIDQNTSSEAVLLKHGDVFSVQSFMFVFSENEP